MICCVAFSSVSGRWSRCRRRVLGHRLPRAEQPVMLWPSRARAAANGSGRSAKLGRVQPLERGLQLRDHVLPIMRRLGRWQMVDGVRVLMYGLGPFSLALHSGFAKLSAEIDGASDGPALASHRRPRRETALLYRLDIWRGAKVFSL